MIINGLRIITQDEARASTYRAWQRFDRAEFERQRFFRLLGAEAIMLILLILFILSK